MDLATWRGMLVDPPEELTPLERKNWLSNLQDVALSSDAFFPFRDNIDRAMQVMYSCTFVHKTPSMLTPSSMAGSWQQWS